MAAKLILHSDDFGLHPEVNRAVFEAADKGVLTSTSLMVNGWGAEGAVRGALNLAQLGVGIHLNILRGRPLSPPSEIPTLLGPDGRFLKSVPKLIMRAALGQLNESHIYTEYRRQILFMMERGLRPTHFDGEKHTHLMLPQAVRALKKLSEEFCINKIRRIREKPLLNLLLKKNVPFTNLTKQRLKLFALEYSTRRTTDQWKGVAGPDLTFGVLVSGCIDSANSVPVLETFLSIPETLIIEWFFHLGYPFDPGMNGFNEEFGDFFLNEARQKETEFLLSDSVRDILSDHKHQLISYKDLA